MYTKTKKFLLIFLLAELLLSYSPAFAQTAPPPYTGVQDQIAKYLCTPNPVADSQTSLTNGAFQNPTTFATNAAANNSNAGVLYQCINQLYKFAIVIAGVFGVFFIVIAGYLYMSSDGNSETTNKAKDILVTTITSFVILMSGFLLLKTINPDLIQFHNVQPPTVVPNNVQPPSTSGGTGGTGGVGGTNPAGGQCSDSPDLCSAQSSCSPNACPAYAQIIQNVASKVTIPGVDTKKMITAIMWHESRCNISAASNAGACGLMQILPTTANTLKTQCKIDANTTITCSWLQDPANAQASICIGAYYMQSLAQGACGADIRNIAAGYDGGNGACAKSVNCATTPSCSGQPMRAWECTFDNDNPTTHEKVCNTGFKETRNYVPDLVGCYNKQ